MDTYADKAQRQERRNQLKADKCKGSIFWTARFILNYKDFSPVVHFIVCAWVQWAIRSGRTRLLLMVPRDYFKTSIVIATIVWILINNPDASILFVMHNLKMAIGKMDEVKSAFMSDAMKRLFPDLWVSQARKAGFRWAKDEFTIPRPKGTAGDPSVMCAGITSGTVGGHFDFIFWDDPIKGDDEEAAAQLKSAIYKQKTVRYLFKRHSPGVWMVIGTFWEGGFYEGLLDNERFHKLTLGELIDDRFYKIVKQLQLNLPHRNSKWAKLYCKEENKQHLWEPGTPIWPEHVNMEMVGEAQDESEEHYQTQAMNLPSTEQMKRFRREDFCEYELKRTASGKPESFVIDSNLILPYSKSRRILMLDPSGGFNRKGDRAGMVVSAWLPIQALEFTLDFWVGVPGKSASKDDFVMLQIETALDLALEWDVDYIGVEHVGLQYTVGLWMKNEIIRRGLNMRVRPVNMTTHKSKAVRAFDTLRPFLANRQFHFLMPDHEPIIDEIYGLNRSIKKGALVGESPPLADCMVMAAMQYRTRKRNQFTKGAGFQEIAPPIADEKETPDYRDIPPKFGMRCLTGIRPGSL